MNLWIMDDSMHYPDFHIPFLIEKMIRKKILRDNKMKKIQIIILCLLSAGVAMAQQSLSLSDAISLALENNYELKVSESQQKIAGINNTWGNTSIMPRIDFNANGRENFNFNSNDNYRTRTLSPEVSLNWVIFDGFSARINKERFEELENQSKGNTAILIESTIQDVILAYNNCLLQKEIMSVYEELMNLSEDRYQRTQSSKELGVSTTYDNLQAKTSWLEDQSNYFKQKLQYENSIRTLNFLMAVDDNTDWGLITKLEFDLPDYNYEALSSRLVEGNKTLQNQYIYQTLLAKETELAKAAYMPKLSLASGVNYNGMDQYYSGNTPDINQSSSNGYVGLTLSWNIFSGGARQRGIEIAKINEDMATIQTSQIKHSLSNQLLQYYSNYNVQRSVLDLATQQVECAELNLQLSGEKLQNGSINSFNYRDVQILYMNSMISKYNAIFDLIKTNVDLLRITGGIIDEYSK